jgi:hypothetical protein
MKSSILPVVILAVCSHVSFVSKGQSSLSLSFPMIWSDVKVKDNWTPPTAPNYKEYREGSAFGYGITLSYSFQPRFIIKDKHFFFDIGTGYFSQKFEIRRPFDYVSMFDLIYRTEYYIYRNWLWTAGLTYNYQIKRRIILVTKASYIGLHSFRQEYTPTSGDLTQKNKKNIDFGEMLTINVGLDKKLGNRFLAGIHISLPVYTRWRNDVVFKDDPSTFSQPNFSLGAVVRIQYLLKKAQP